MVCGAAVRNARMEVASRIQLNSKTVYPPTLMLYFSARIGLAICLDPGPPLFFLFHFVFIFIYLLYDEICTPAVEN